MAYTYFLLWLCVALNTAPTLFLKEATLIAGDLPEDFSNFSGWIVDLVSNPYGICAIFLFILSLMAFPMALSRLKLSYMFPIVQAIPLVLTAIFSFLLFEEKVPWLGWLAIVTICAGVLLLSTRPGTSDSTL